MKPEQIIEIIRKYAINETNQAGDSGDVIWDTEFLDFASEIRQLHEEELKKALRAAWNAGMDYDRNISNKNFNDFINEYLKSKP